MTTTEQAIDDLLENAPIVVRAEHVSKHFVLRRDKALKDRLLAFRAGRRNREFFTALEDISLDIQAGHTVALIGHNGSGKSTLLKLIGGILDPSSGTISRRGRVAALLELGAGFHPDLSGRDNVFLNASLLGMSREQTEQVFDDIVEFAEIEDFIDTQVKFYSSGMYVRLAFAVAIHTDPEILLVDEVLAVGDEAFQRKCMDVIRRFQAEGRTILLVTHSMSQVLELADSAVLLDHGRLLYQGEPRAAVAWFRDLLDENRVKREALHLAEADEPRVVPDFEVHVSAFGEGRQHGQTVEVGDTLVVDLEFVGEIGEEGWKFSLQIDNPMGIGILGMATDLLGMHLASMKGSARYTVQIPGMRLGEGKYFIGVYVFDAEGKRIHEFPQATSISARAPRTSRGLISMEYTIDQRP